MNWYNDLHLVKTIPLLCVLWFNLVKRILSSNDNELLTTWNSVRSYTYLLYQNHVKSLYWLM